MGTVGKICLLYVLAIIVSSADAADLYRYVDKSGSVVITDKWASIPERYRSKVKVIKDDSPPKPGTPLITPQEAPASVPAQEPAVTVDGKDWKRKYLQPVTIIILISAAFFAVTKVISGLGRAAGAVILIVFSTLIGLFLYRVYIDRISETYQSLKKDALNIKKNVEARPNKTDVIINKSEEAAAGKP